MTDVPLPVAQTVRRLRAFRRSLSQSWSREDVESAFYSAGGLPQWASEFFAKHDGKPPRDWRLMVPRVVVSKRQISNTQ